MVFLTQNLFSFYHFFKLFFHCLQTPARKYLLKVACCANSPELLNQSYVKYAGCNRGLGSLTLRELSWYKKIEIEWESMPPHYGEVLALSTTLVTLFCRLSLSELYLTNECLAYYFESVAKPVCVLCKQNYNIHESILLFLSLQFSTGIENRKQSNIILEVDGLKETRTPSLKMLFQLS